MNMSHWQRILAFIKKHALWGLLSLGLVNGLIFVFLVPPWMHYDEPGHLEYAWLIANKPGLPEHRDYDQLMRRQISGSIIEHDIEAYTGMTSNPLEIDRPITIWIPQVDEHPPTYYLLAALPLYLFRHTDINFQLTLVRLVSLSLFLTLVWAAYRIALELFGRGHPLTWMVPLFVVTLPAFVDMMTAANNDALANLAFTLFIWASIVLIKRGVKPLRLLALFAAVLLSVLTKSTAWLAAPLSLLAFLIALLRGKKYAKFVWLALVVFMIFILGMLVSWDSTAPAFYYGANPIREMTDKAPLGERVIAQPYFEDQNTRFHWTRQRMFSLLSPQALSALAGNQVTLGAWVWADSPTTISFPEIQVEQIAEPILSPAPAPSRPRLPFPFTREVHSGESTKVVFSSDPIELSRSPQFFAFSATMPHYGGDINWVIFHPSTEVGNTIYWDGVVLAAGGFSGTPLFDDDNAQSGTWDGVQFVNAIRNASGEAPWPKFADWINQYIPNRLNPGMSGYLSILDAQAASVYYQYAGARVFRTFWSVFGWANVGLYGQKPYRFFFVLSAVFMIGFLISLLRRSTGLSWQKFVFLAAAIVLQVLVVMFRGAGSWFSVPYIPVGRYLYPIILPITLLLVIGAYQIICLVNKLIRIPNQVLYGVYICLQLGIMLWAILSINLFYHF